MSRRQVAGVTDDFALVLELLASRGILEDQPPHAKVINARRIHEMTYSLILWRFRLRKLPPHSAVFIDEIASDALQILPQCLMGYGKTTRLLIRGILENTFRHIYFTDHPIEFARMNRDKKWYLGVTELCEYAKIHPDFVITEPRYNAIDQAVSLYSDLSGAVHGRTVRDLEMRTSLTKIQYEEVQAKRDVEFLRRCVETVNFLLCVFHCSAVRALPTEDRRVFLRSMPKKARETWSDHG